MLRTIYLSYFYISEKNQCEESFMVKKDLSKFYVLIFITVGPSSVTFSNTLNGKLYIPEYQNLTIKCTANGAGLAPNVQLRMMGKIITTYSRYFIEINVPSISRSYDGANVTCLASYSNIHDTPVTNSTVIILYCKYSSRWYWKKYSWCTPIVCKIFLMNDMKKQVIKHEKTSTSYYDT